MVYFFFDTFNCSLIGRHKQCYIYIDVHSLWFLSNYLTEQTEQTHRNGRSVVPGRDYDRRDVRVHTTLTMVHYGPDVSLVLPALPFPSLM